MFRGIEKESSPSEMCLPNHNILAKWHTQETILTMMSKRKLYAEKRWRKIRGFNHLALVPEGKTFKDRVLESDSEHDTA